VNAIVHLSHHILEQLILSKSHHLLVAAASVPEKEG
jgi:hypothetical protein